MIKLVISLFIISILISCKIDTSYKSDKKSLSETKEVNKSKSIKKTLKYIVGDKYFIQGVEYIPEENYNYSSVGLATFYGKELHNKKTINNDLNKVTELLGRHKTLPIPSIVKVTNIENGLSLILKINDRHDDNSSIIQVSRKSAQILKFYKNKIAKVRVEILSDPSKQMKVVFKSMDDSSFNDTIVSSPTESVTIVDLDEKKRNDSVENIEQPIEVGFENISNKDLFLKIYNFASYNDIKSSILDLNITHKYTSQNNNGSYILTIGPLENIEANNLVLSFISKGYKYSEFILE